MTRQINWAVMRKTASGGPLRRAADGNDLTSIVAEGEFEECHCHTTPPWFEI